MSSRLREIAHETVAITERGSYRSGHREVAIREQVAEAVAGTRAAGRLRPVRVR